MTTPDLSNSQQQNGSSHVLVVEDDSKIALALRDFLLAAGFQVHCCANGLEAVSLARDLRPHCILLDLNLPGLEGIEVCKRIRQFSQVPIAMVTARVDELDRLLGLELGADDYICKPFSAREVVARVKVLLRRTSNLPLNSSTSEAASAKAQATNEVKIAIDPAAMRVRVADLNLPLTTAEFHLMATLVAKPGRIYSRAQLVDAASGTRGEMSERTVDSHLRNLRRKLEEVGVTAGHIRSVYGIGYAWESA